MLTPTSGSLVEGIFKNEGRDLIIIYGSKKLMNDNSNVRYKLIDIFGRDIYKTSTHII